MLKITTPKPYTGDVLGVRFTEGRAVVDPAEHRAAVAYFRRHDGYTVAAIEDDADESDGTSTSEDGEGPAEDGDAPARPPGNASRETWERYAERIGVDTDDIAAAASRADVIALVDEHQAEETDPA